MRNECNIIRDILPLYVEGLVSPDTAAFAEEHICGCPGCAAELERMRVPGGVETGPAAQDMDAANLKAFKRKWGKRKRLLICGTAVVTVLALLTAFLITWGPAIFQRGNPVPYLLAAMRISDERPYIQVAAENGMEIFISRRGPCPELFAYVEESRNVEFQEQGGSAFIFSNGVERVVISSEIYFGRFVVWQVSAKTVAAK